MKSSESSHFSVAGGTAYSTWGSGEPVVLIHGVGMEHGVWRPQVPALAEAHQVIALDMLGHGQSRVPGAQVRLADYAAQVAELLDHLKLPAANIVGHSMGALVALEFGLNYPSRCLRVAALNAVFERTPEQREAVQRRAGLLHEAGIGATVDDTIERWFGAPIPDAMKDSADMVAGFLKRVHPLGYARTYQLFATSDRVHADRLAELRMPALFMTAEFDANSSPAMSRAMAARVAGSSAKVIPGARHMMTVTDPHRVNEALRDFLERPLMPVATIEAAGTA